MTLTSCSSNRSMASEAQHRARALVFEAAGQSIHQSSNIRNSNSFGFPRFSFSRARLLARSHSLAFDLSVLCAWRASWLVRSRSGSAAVNRTRWNGVRSL